ncbi:MAG TPA: ATP-binding protein, partial [Candidatus Stackebrandtia faecavium]|nr:ATP-binding protein [Candidatus Stackebrandtia faecavium]
MDPQIRDALQRLKLEFTVAMGDVWEHSDVHYAHNEAVARGLKDGIADAAARTRSSARGEIIVGQAGSGKTHLIRRARMSLAEEGGFFVQFDINSHDDFWDAMLGAYRTSLEVNNGGETQLRRLLSKIIDTNGVSQEAAMEIKDGRPTVQSVTAVVTAVSDRHPELDDVCRDALRVLCIFSSPEIPCRDMASHWLSGLEEAERGQRAKWKLHPAPRSTMEIVRALTRIMALVGPTLIAVDQIDSLVQKSSRATDGSGEHTRADDRLDALCDDIMTFAEKTWRTFTVVTCLLPTWEQLKATSLYSSDGRFQSPKYLEDTLPGDTAQQIVAVHVHSRLRDAPFTPPDRCWPVLPEAFGATVNLNPRRLLRTVTDHAQWCLERDEFTPLASFDRSESDAPNDDGDSGARFAQLMDELSSVEVIDKAHEDEQFPRLLAAGIESMNQEIGARITVRPEFSASKRGMHVVAHRDE